MRKTTKTFTRMSGCDSDRELIARFRQKTRLVLTSKNGRLPLQSFPRSCNSSSLPPGRRRLRSIPNHAANVFLSSED